MTARLAPLAAPEGPGPARAGAAERLPAGSRIRRTDISAH